MKNRIDIENNKHLRQRPFAVPQDYFLHLEEGLKNIPQEHPTTKIYFLQKTWVKYVAVAATLVLAFTIGWFSQTPATKDQLTPDDIQALSEHGYLPVTETDILMIFTDEDWQVLSQNEQESQTEYLEATQPDLVEDYYLTIDNI